MGVGNAWGSKSDCKISNFIRTNLLNFHFSTQLIASESGLKWYSAGKFDEYNIRIDGTVEGRDGATISIKSNSADGLNYGGASQFLNGHRLQMKSITFSANVTTRSVSDNISLWLRADDENGRHLEFRSTSRRIVNGDTDSQPLELSLDVPSAAKTVGYGVVLKGTGEAKIEHAKIVVSNLDAGGLVSPVILINECMEIIKKHALANKTIDWPTTEADMKASVEGKKLSVDAYPAIENLVARLGDRHSFFTDRHEVKTAKGENYITSKVAIRMLDHGIGYIAIPGYFGGNNIASHRFTNDVDAQIVDMAYAAKKGWIIDLRADCGGNMWPMLAALRRFLGKYKLGSFVAHGKSIADWTIPTSEFGDNGKNANLLNARVAILVGSHTASSGEAVAIAFHGRGQTMSFGQPTAGLTTANGSYFLSDGSELHLAYAVDADRFGNVFGEKFQPDIIIENNNSGSDEDSTLLAAKRWILQ